MVKGFNLIGFEESRLGDVQLKAFSPIKNEDLPEIFSAATLEEIKLATKKATEAFKLYKAVPTLQRAVFLETIAEEILNIGDELIRRAMLESGLPEARLIGERGRTIGQLKLFADILKEGSWGRSGDR